MQLTLTEPNEQHTYTIHWIRVDAVSGNMLIQENHAPTLLTLRPNSTITYEDSKGEVHTYIAKKAILEVSRSAVHLLNQA